MKKIISTKQSYSPKFDTMFKEAMDTTIHFQNADEAILSARFARREDYGVMLNYVMYLHTVVLDRMGSSAPYSEVDRYLGTKLYLGELYLSTCKRGTRVVREV